MLRNSLAVRARRLVLKHRNKPNRAPTPHRIYGHGIDIVDIGQFRALIGFVTEESVSRYFTKDELSEVGESPVRIERLAGRFALKEAVMKALGVGWGNGISFSDVETITSVSGQPGIRLHRNIAKLANRRGVGMWAVSTAHSETSAIASAIALGE